MPVNSTLTTSQCLLKESIDVTLVLALLGLPVNFLLFKALMGALRLELPRHKILLSLTVSDCFQISVSAVIQQIMRVSGIEMTSVACQVLRRVVGVITGVTIMASSGSIVALSVERYFACVHCYRAHEIVSDKRVVRALFGIWGFGLICSLLDKQSYRFDFSSTVYQPAMVSRVIFAGIVLTSTAILLYVQVRLYQVSRRLMRVNPGVGGASVPVEDANNLRRDQMRVAIAASAVIVMYVVCMCPLAFYFMLFDVLEKTKEHETIGFICYLLALLNTFADPFVYGFGMSDTRQAIKRELRKFKTFVNNVFSH